LALFHARDHNDIHALFIVIVQFKQVSKWTCSTSLWCVHFCTNLVL